MFILLQQMDVQLQTMLSLLLTQRQRYQVRLPLLIYAVHLHLPTLPLQIQ